LRWLVQRMRQDFDGHAAAHPVVRDALAALEEAVAEEFPSAPPRKAKRGKLVTLASAREAALKAKLKWARHRLRKAEARLTQLQTGKDAARHNRLTPAFLTKVALSWPSTSARAFAKAWRDLVGVGASGCSRTTISKVKDAFAEAATPQGDGGAFNFR